MDGKRGSIIPCTHLGTASPESGDLGLGLEWRRDMKESTVPTRPICMDEQR